MTETSSAGTANEQHHTLVKMTLDNGEDVQVCAETEQNVYYFEELDYTEPAVFKCSQCKHLAIHAGVEVVINETTVAVQKRLRYYLCTICGTFRYKG